QAASRSGTGTEQLQRAGAVVKKRQIPASSAGMTVGYVRQDTERVLCKGIFINENFERIKKTILSRFQLFTVSLI
ncbi:hypothetical protein, partial [uncultured Treponema sp.]|uniref:hypothetical protein n=1 Tax=uncultured Treponema sp. TaxID=162155 RepID=UPI002599E909